MGRWGHSWQSLAIDTVDWLLVLSLESESVLKVLCNVGEEVELDMSDSLVQVFGASVCLVVLHMEYHSLPQGVSNWSILGSVGENGHETELEWVLEGLGKGLLRWVGGLEYWLWRYV